MNLQSKIFIAGHRGMVGSAIKRKLESKVIQTSYSEPTANSTLKVSKKSMISSNQKDLNMSF